MITVIGKKISLGDLRGVTPTTPANAGRRWAAIPHAELVDTIKDECLTRNWRVKEELFTLTNEGADMAGALLLEGVRGVTVPTGQTLALGFLNNNSRRKALKITVGTSVMCCNNGMCSGDILLRRVHDQTVDLPDEVDVALDRYVEAAGGLALGVARLREQDLSPAQASDILLEAGRRGLVGWATVGRVDAEYRKPTFAEHGQHNSWALLQAFTYAARPNINPIKQMEVYNAFRQLLPVAGVAGLS